MDMDIAVLKKRFKDKYGGDESAIRIFTSPGRVNLIGEHTDYNGGYVLPAALTLSSTAAVRPRKDRIINLAATDLENFAISASLDRLDEYKHQNLRWGNYQLGVADELQKAGYSLTGCDMLFHDTVPLKSGLSSSAAIEVATALALAALALSTPPGTATPGTATPGTATARTATPGTATARTAWQADMKSLAIICQSAEHNYIGVKCGIMDQFASAFGKTGHAIFLNCKDLHHEYVPLDLNGYRIVLADTKKQRSLSTVKYNERRNECDQGLKILKMALPDICYLCDLSPDRFERYRHLIKDDLIIKRVSHVIYENNRVLKSVEALRKGDIDAFGAYMVQSHESLRDLYEVTGPELDALMEEALKIKGVIGTRMTGAGFGGCTVSIVKEAAVEDFIEKTGKGYTERTGSSAEFYISAVGDGAREITYGT